MVPAHTCNGLKGGVKINKGFRYSCLFCKVCNTGHSVGTLVLRNRSRRQYRRSFGFIGIIVPLEALLNRSPASVTLAYGHRQGKPALARGGHVLSDTRLFSQVGRVTFLFTSLSFFRCRLDLGSMYTFPPIFKWGFCSSCREW
jgi:hypothetical protein